jgi:hypothetical protein
MRRRAVLAGVPGVLLLPGCTDLLTEGEAEFEAERGIVGESARSEANYAEANRTEDAVERNYEGVDRTVVVVNKLTEYSRGVEFPLGVSGELARFTVLATPEVDIVPGDPANPVADMDNDELAMMVQEQYGTIDNVRKLDEREADLLGETVTAGRYEADAQTQGEATDVNLHIAQGESGRSDNGRDFVVTVAVHPSDIDERDRVDRMLAGVQHPV